MVFRILLLAAMALLYRSQAYAYPYHNEQTRLSDASNGPQVSLAFRNATTLHFSPPFSKTRLPLFLSLKNLEDTIRQGFSPSSLNAMVRVPQATGLAGSLSFGVDDPVKSRDSDFQYIASASMATLSPGNSLKLKQSYTRPAGTLVGKDPPTTYKSPSYAHLSLDSPFLVVPKHAYKALISAIPPIYYITTFRKPWHVLVNCAAVSIFPELVFKFEGEKGGLVEMVLRPEQYILGLVDKDGTQECALLVKEGEDGEDEGVSFGWGALRGRGVWLDWDRGMLAVSGMSMAQ